MTAYNYDRARMELFDETRVEDTLISNGLFPEFSNSFFRTGEMGRRNMNHTTEEILYIKYANERNREFAVRTEILENIDGKRSVKNAAVPGGKGTCGRSYGKVPQTGTGL